MANPYLVSGVIYTTKGKIPNSVVVILDTSNNQSLQTTTNEVGQYVIDLGNFTDEDYVIGNSYTIRSWDNDNNEYVSETITLTGENLEKDLYLNLRDDQNELGMKNQIASLRLPGYKPVNKDNPLPVMNEDRVFTEKYAYSGSLIEYLGHASPGISPSQPRWRIKKLLYSGTNVTDVQWADGNTNFDNIWDNRATYDYS